jgi:hypothetical protein
MNFDVEFCIEGIYGDANYNGLMQTKGKLYLFEHQMIFGDENRWYKLNIEDINDIVSMSNKQKVSLKFEEFNVLLYCDNYSHLRALRDYIYINKFSTKLNNST